jgi:DNA replication initiation complex subunit (GINS family)
MTGDGIGFSEISDVHRNERRSKVLTKLPPHFHEKAEEHLQTLRNEHCSAIREPGNPAAMMLWDQISKVDKRLKMIYELRERKITLAALDRMLGAAHPENMSKKEKILYDQLVEVLASFRKGVEIKVEKECPQPFSAELPKPEPVNAQKMIVAPEPEPVVATPVNPETAIVHVLEDIPEFAGMSTDYELKKDDMVTLPSQFATILSSRGLVRIVSG